MMIIIINITSIMLMIMTITFIIVMHCSRMPTHADNPNSIKARRRDPRGVLHVDFYL